MWLKDGFDVALMEGVMTKKAISNLKASLDEKYPNKVSYLFFFLSISSHLFL
jgi:hypothetical protein